MTTSNNCSYAGWIVAVILFVALITGAWYHQLTVSQLEGRLNNAAGQNNDQANTTPTDTTEPETPTETGELATFSNHAYGYILEYPDTYQVKIYRDESATIGTVTGVGFDEVVDGKVGLSVISAETDDERNAKIEDYIFNRAKTACDADGAGASITCPRRKSFEPLKIASGLEAYTMVLEEETRIFGPEASTTKRDRTMYAVKVGNPTRRSFLIIQVVGDGTEEMAKNVALTVRAF